jgi:hypothetical protein
VLFWLFCGAVLSLLVFTVVEDENRVHARVKESLLKQSSTALEVSTDVEKSTYGPPFTPSKRDTLSPQTAYLRISDGPIITPSPCAEVITTTTTEVYCTSRNPIHYINENYFQQASESRPSMPPY